MESVSGVLASLPLVDLLRRVEEGVEEGMKESQPLPFGRLPPILMHISCNAHRLVSDMAHRDAPAFSKLHAQLILQCPPGFPEFKRLFMMQALIRETQLHYDRADPTVLRPLISKYLLSVVVDASSGRMRPTRGAKGEIGGHIAHMIRYVSLIPAERAGDESSSLRRWIATAKELNEDQEVAKLFIELGEASEGILRAALGGILGYITSECARNGTPIRPWIPSKE